MKQNEMVEEIASVLLDNAYEDNFLQVAWEIMHRIEGLGMLPPINKSIGQGDDEAIRGLKGRKEDV